MTSGATLRHPLWLGTYPPGGAGAPAGSGEGLWFLGAAGPVQVAPSPSPSFLAAHPRAPRLYAVAEQVDGAVATFAVTEDGAATPLATVRSGGTAPCHLAVHPSGRWLYVANYGDGVASAIGLDDAGNPTSDVVLLRHDGSGPNADRQAGPHAHSCTLSPGGTHLLVADLGTDQLRAYPLDAEGRPGAQPVLSDLPPGTGPRHVAVDGETLYVTLELSDEVAVLAWDAATARADLLSRVPTTARRPGSGGPASFPSHLELTVRDDGTALLDVGVRGADVISTFAVHRDDVPSLDLIGECPTATWPRHFVAVREGAGRVVVAGERAHQVVVHERDTTGVLRPATVRLDVPAPACVVPQRASSVVENE
ncbi:putative secreted protein [Beutenbergia cavernae DSM 12333]|uniref:Putative secreted protein n=1 Tax=Beutenbergia cavernae (strain ATCC BAA-8 / DSM 12333 / CCUG 43141 / JCM 11478 / NBRC 16432 / NCIMB 13614 / HKI 0122) TaxID=471853 RepID=C5BYM6_BEUC1|nr:beta-propeller fold lactonase family protein [Beutenbergia cavernae]ACQ78984.1 putative secreted protein [Beutenbergia cavernae DSM 12333]